ncbi:7213_t:CDS:1, partial [Cetraspora pellucida]
FSLGGTHIIRNVQCPMLFGPMEWTGLDMGGPMSMSNVRANTGLDYE